MQPHKTVSHEEWIELPGSSVFLEDESGQIFHTCSVLSRGPPKGRNEPPGGNLSAWVRHHDKYDEAPDKSCCHG